MIFDPKLASKIEITPTCWLWKGARTSRGYGQKSVASKGRQAHRVVWEVTRGPVPKGLVLDHLCRVRHCVNPDHLEPVTQRVNVLRGEAPAARLAAATECKRGHAFDVANTRRRPDGSRECRTCKSASNAARVRRHG